MSARIIYFPSSRSYAGVRVERERGGDGWVALADAAGWLHGDWHSACADAREIAAGFGTTARSSAGWLS
jgi:hypothetical protein